MKLSNENSHLIDIAIKEGEFKFHHAKEDYVMLSKWLPKDIPNKLPHFASHYVGVGGLVLSPDSLKILTIQERRSAAEGGPWKLPGGLVEKGESI